jgi:hypothetical protein
MRSVWSPGLYSNETETDEKGTATMKLTTTTLDLVDAVHPERGVDPGLPAHRPPAVRNGHGRPKHVT